MLSRLSIRVLRSSNVEKICGQFVLRDVITLRGARPTILEAILRQLQAHADNGEDLRFSLESNVLGTRRLYRFDRGQFLFTRGERQPESHFADGFRIPRISS